MPFLLPPYCSLTFCLYLFYITLDLYALIFPSSPLPPILLPLPPPVLLLQEGRVWVGGGGAGLRRDVPPPAGPLQSQHCGGDGRRLLHPKWPRPFLHPSSCQETNALPDLLSVLHALWAAFLPPASSAAAPPTARRLEERRGPDQLPQRPAAGSGPASACEHYKLPETKPRPLGHHEGHVHTQLQHQHRCLAGPGWTSVPVYAYMIWDGLDGTGLDSDHVTVILTSLVQPSGVWSSLVLLVTSCRMEDSDGSQDRIFRRYYAQVWDLTSAPM